MKNNKGFMLAEVVVTSTIVLTSLISLYITFNKLYNNYEIRSNYYDVDGIYAIKNMINNLIDNDDLNKKLKGITNINPTFSIIKDKDCYDATNTKCDRLQGAYNINNMYIAAFEQKAIDNIKSNTNNQTFKDYLEFIKNHYNLNDKTKYNYLFIVEYQKNNDDKYYYSSLGVG